MVKTKHYKELPYISNPGNACALSCATMVAQYYFPEVTFDDLAKVSKWKPGYAVWGFAFRKWIMSKGISVKHTENKDYLLWANEGVAGLQKITETEEFKWIKDNTYNLESYSDIIREVFSDDRFTFINREVTWDDLVQAHIHDEICTLTLNCSLLDQGAGYEPHVVAVLDIDETHVLFHDPRDENDDRPYSQVTHDIFRKSFEKLPTAELVTFIKQ